MIFSLSVPRMSQPPLLLLLSPPLIQSVCVFLLEICLKKPNYWWLSSDFRSRISGTTSPTSIVHRGCKSLWEAKKLQQHLEHEEQLYRWNIRLRHANDMRSTFNCEWRLKKKPSVVNMSCCAVRCQNCKTVQNDLKCRITPSNHTHFHANDRYFRL